MTDSKREARIWWTDGEYISNHMDETEEQLLESDFFQVVEKSEFDALVKENAELKEKVTAGQLNIMKLAGQKDAEITRLRDLLEAIRSQMCWEDL